MCTTDCYCWEGPGGQYRKKWEQQGEKVFNKFNRTTLAKSFSVNETYYYPFKWSTKQSETKLNFQQCYNDVLKKFDHSKYGWIGRPAVKTLIDQFFKKKGNAKISGFDFFVDLEKNFKCSSVC